jgi:murein DD-endopeptidase MepM/ murein hydrolase activator NlpD
VRLLAGALTLVVVAVAGHDVQSGAAANPCLDFDRLYAAIRDGAIDREAARERVRTLLPRIRDDFYARGGRDAPAGAWRFPLEGYAANAIGGKNGSGYVADGYDYFDGYKSHGHPGHDLFIHDRNQDELDDATGKPVDVLSIGSGIVVARASEWDRGSILRGGRYIYVYDPARGGMFYYAHNRSVLVMPGDIVTPGQVIATVGRSGRNASAPRSPTHLHVMFLAIEDGYPKPRDIYQDLLRLGRWPHAR